MSSNQNSADRKKVTSISRKMQWMVISEKLSSAVFGSIGLFFILALAWVLYVEYRAFGYLSFERSRELVSVSRSLEDIRYAVSEGAMAVSLPVFGPAMGMLAISGGVMALKFLGALTDIPSNRRRIRGILTPIDEIAAKADEIARFDFSEDKYQVLEDAIASMDPADSEIHIESKELQGVQDAMNSLIAKMRESNRQQARFVNDASHELRTPIAVIEGYANMLSRWGKEDEKVLDESISAILHESEHMKHLVEQLLFLARGDAGRTSLEKTDVSINNLMQEIYEESLMIDENHTYRFHPSETDVVLNADPGLLKQAVRILVDNAAKYTKSGDEIILGTGETEDGSVYLQVQDTGIGMAESDVEHMFERFYRADKARNTEGTGLGLSIAKWIVDKHGGHFDILSRTEIGTRIRIVL